MPDSHHQTAQFKIPKVEQAPMLEDFLDMKPSDKWNGKLARVEGFIQSAPDDGKPATEQTETYFGYDQRNLYVVFVAHDRSPDKIRARLERREGVQDDEDQVGIYLDTFHDRRRGYQFGCNALGIQFDSIYSEDSETNDFSFDTLWASRGKLTSAGFVVWISIPFKSLRFSQTSSQEWGMAMYRWIPRRAEGSWWPRVSSKVRGRVSQGGTVTGIEAISPGRNIQLIPYFSFRSFHAVDMRNPAEPMYNNRTAEFSSGLDAKIILKDSLVLDLTAKPDFSQVESDDPQTTVNQRFEVFFPEKRPFFTENSSYFEVPMTKNNSLLFTRRIGDPDFGARLTGRLGRYSVGALVADDKSPGESVPPGDPLEGKRAYFDVLRLSRDLPRQSNIGVMYTDRRFAGSYNRVFAADGTFRLDKNWTAVFFGANSWTWPPIGESDAGRDLEARVTRTGRGFNYKLQSVDRAPEFLPLAGFIYRNDIRFLTQDAYYQFWPQDSWLTKITPELYLERGWFFHGGNSFATFNPSLSMEVKHQTTLGVHLSLWNDELRPKDYPALAQTQTFQERGYGFSVSSAQLRLVTLSAKYEWGTRLNYIPPAGQAPYLADYSHGEAGFSLLTSRGLSISNTYLLDRNLSRSDGRAIYNSHIIQSKWNWQLNRELSVRFIGQYNALVVNPVLTSSPTARTFNVDFLITYLIYPGTAVYVGYNSNLSRPGPPVGGPSLDRFVNDGRQFFVKASYLFRF